MIYVCYYDGDHELPMLLDNPTSFLAKEVAKVLNESRCEYCVPCSTKGMTKNTTFVIDVDDVAFTDLKADNLGTWKATGTKSIYFSIRSSGVIMIISGNETNKLYGT